LIFKRIKFIDVELVPKEFYLKAQRLTFDIDIDDTEFIALTEYIDGKFWSGDNALINGLNRKGWKKLFHYRK
jgi:predicted nucleic acid-binding protein